MTSRAWKVTIIFWTKSPNPCPIPAPPSRKSRESPLRISRTASGTSHARTKDRAGNLSPQAGHFKVAIDTLAAPPKVSSPTHSEDGRWYKDRRVAVQWEDPFDHSGVEGFYYNIDRKSDTIPNDKNSLFTNRTGPFPSSSPTTGFGISISPPRTRPATLIGRRSIIPCRVDT